LVGNPQNMLCASLGKLGFARYALHMLPVVVLGLAANHAILALLFRRDLESELPSEPVTEPVLSARASVTLGVIAATVGFYLAGAHMTYTALTAFAVLLILHRIDPAEIWARIDWSVLIFFGGLFVSVNGFVRSGAPAFVFSKVPLFLPPESLAS